MKDQLANKIKGEKGKTKVSEHKTKIRLEKMKMERLIKKYPDFNFEEAVKIISDIEKFSKARIRAFWANFNAERCQDKKWKNRCSECDCWKLKYVDKWE